MARSTPLPLLLSLLLSCAVSANGIYSADGRLHLPWVAVGDALYGAALEAHGGGFVLGDVRVRGELAQEARPALATLADDGTLHLPRVEFDGRFYTVELRRVSPMEWVMERVAPADEPVGRGALVELTALGEEALSTISALTPIWPSGVTPRYDVELLRMVYRTVDPFGSLTSASALLALPVGADGALPLAAYQHGTLLRRDAAPSFGESGEGPLLARVMAATGYVAVAPDYLGLGASDGLHPFVHATSTATAVVDALRAAREAAATRSVALDGSLFITGYSEGGYVTLAAQRALERDHGDEFTVTASAPMAGPYDLSGTMREMVLAGTPHDSPYYFPYLLFGYDRVYGLFDDYGELFSGELATALPPLYDGEHGSDEVNALLPSMPAEALTPALLTALRDDPEAPINRALVGNDLLNWAPQVPTRLYHCVDDAVVPFANSQVAYDAFIARGAPQVELAALPGDDHAGCAVFALLNAGSWFASLR